MNTPLATDWRGSPGGHDSPRQSIGATLCRSRLHRWAKAILAAILFTLLLCSLPSGVTQAAADQPSHAVYQIGVLAYKGKASARKRWSAHSAYLNQRLAPNKFEIVPLTYAGDELTKAVIGRQVDFVITNPGHYIELELDGHLSRLATRRMSSPQGVLDTFGGTAITRPDRIDINRYTDLAGKRILIPSKSSLGGWQVHLREAMAQGVDLRTDASIVELKNHRKVVEAILEGQADAGFVRSDLIEELLTEGMLRLDDLKVVDNKTEPAYPYLLSTHLYPEWPFAVVSGTSVELAGKVLSSLLEMSPTDTAATAAGIHGWTIPGHYSAVGDLFREVGLGPYARQSLTLGAVVQEYRMEILVLLFFTLVLIFGALKTIKTNRALQREVLERRVAEAALCEKDFVLQSAASAIGVGDLDGTVTYVNQAFLNLWGFAGIDEVVGRPFTELWMVGDRVDEIMAALMGEERKWYADIQARKKDGSIFDVHVSAAAVLDDIGEPVGLMSTSVDITKRLQVQEALSKRESQLAESQMVALLGSWDLDLVTSELTWSEQTYRLFGQDPVSFKPSFELFARMVHGDDLEIMQTNFNKALRGEDTAYHAVVRVINDSGRGWVMEATGVVERDNSNNPIRIFGTAQDITKRQKAEQAAAKSEQEWADAMDYFEDAIYIVDLDDKLSRANNAFYTLTGLTPEQAIGMDITSIIHPQGEAVPCPVCSARKARRDEAILMEANHPHNPSGRPIMVTVRVIRGSTAQALGILMGIRDLSQTRATEARLEQQIEDLVQARKDSLRLMQDLEVARGEAEQASLIKSQFLANMSHEIRTPLNAVTGMSYLLKQTRMTDKQAEYIDAIHRSMGHVMGIINGLLDFSKAEAGMLELEAVPFDLDQVLDDIADFVAQDAEQKRLEILFDIPLDVPRALVGDPLRLGQILANLASNAVKFSDQGHVLISVTQERSEKTSTRLCFSIKDTGIGIDQSQLPRLFQAFQQADSSTTRRYGGTGLGLAICKYLVQAMDGKIELHSTSKEGSEFRFTVQLGLQPQPKHKLINIPADLKDLHFLVVDDNSTAREVLGGILAMLGFDYHMVASGDEALEALKRAQDSAREREYDLVLLDWMMPGIDGIETATRITRDKHLRNPPLIIMVSAFAKERVMQQASRAGVSGYLRKPVSASLLFDIIMQVLGKFMVKTHRRGPATDTQAMIQRIDGGGRSILIVEDQQINRQIAVEVLNRSGFNTESVEDGLQAVELIKRDPGAFEAVLMDLQMPVMDGYEATRRIRQLPGGSKIRIIAMTAHALAKERTKCLEAGMDSHLSKPIDVDVLLAELAGWLDIAPIQTSSDGSLPDLLPENVPGIELTQGLARVLGNHSLYRKLLLSFPQQCIDIIDSIRNALVTGENLAAIHGAHTLAGSAGNLAMVQLREVAAALERTLEAGEPFENVLKRLELSCAEVIESINGLDLTDSTCGPDVVDTGSAAEQLGENPALDLTPQLQELDALLASNDMRAAKLLAAVMDSATDAATVADLKPVREQISQLDFQQARRLLTRFLSRQGSHQAVDGHGG